MTDLLIVIIGSAISVFIVLILKHFLSTANGNPPLPPGPKGLPLVGNLSDLPNPGVLEAHHWLKHKDLYGPISSVTVMGQTLVIINDAQLAFALLEKRSLKHSSRPRQIFAGEMLGWENSLGLSQYNDRFRTYRKNMSRIIGSKTAAAQYSTLQEAEVGHFLLHVLNNPEDLVNQIRKEAGAVILKIAYGYTAEPFKDDVLVTMAGDAMDKFERAGVPGAFMVDMMPFLIYFPDWVPGTGWKRTARQWAAELNDVTEKPYAFVKHQIAQGKDDNSFLSRLLETGDSTPEEKFANKWHFTHDPDVYVEPISFKPERFLPDKGKEAAPDPHMFVFGFGRRICPGRILADNALYLNIAQSLAVFDITRDDNVVHPEMRFTPGVVSHPQPFKTIIKPRTPHQEKLIRSIEHVFPWEESDAGILESMDS
ncbi:hypothetical protein N0V84_000828 [Fusarium piperis]|uniref:O-methylsterigmatocystin oxidoreductase n=1 Tax=Fusarium piperis TaxID=1435070 RepID=A0A9W9BT35_9HYPO|nr:hypothetical protein N0V84_000828 [Fusarium piperis]